MQGIFKRGGIYWFRFSHAGKQRRVSLNTRDEIKALTEARKILCRPEVELGLSRAGSWDAGVEDFMAVKAARGAQARTVENYKGMLAKAKELIGREMLGTITQKDVLRFKAERLASVSAGSAREAWDYLNWFLAWCLKTGRLRNNPCEGMDPPPAVKSARKRFLSKAERKIIMRRPCSKRLKFILYCGLHAGLRKGEIIQARPYWFDLDAGLLHLQGYPSFRHGKLVYPGWVPKDKDDRTIPLTDEFRAFLGKFKFEGADFCIASGIAQGKARYRYDFRAEFVKHLAACGLQDVTFHDLRRTFASQLVSAGVSLFKVGKWLGDNAATAEKHYGHLIPNDDEINKAWK